MKIQIIKSLRKNNYKIKKKCIIIILLCYLSYKFICLNHFQSFNYYYSKYLCNLFILNEENNCNSELLENYDFFYNLKGINRNVHLSIDIKAKSLIENIIFIIGIVPFLKYNSTINYKISNNNIYQFFEKNFIKKSIKDQTAIFDFHDLKVIKQKFHIIINFIWDIIPEKIILDNIRYIIEKYYDEKCLMIFEKSLNNNYKYFIDNNKDEVIKQKSFRNLISK